MAEDFKVKIVTTADTSGAQAAAAALQGLSKTTGETGKETKSLGEELGRLGQRNNEAKDVIEGLDMASRGGAGALFGLAKAARNLWEVFAGSTVLGRVVQLTALAGAGFIALGEKMKGTAADSEAAEKRLDAVKTAFEKIAAAKTESAKTQLTAIKDEAKAAADELQRVIDLRTKLTEATAKADIAAIEANPDLTPAERVAARQAVEDRRIKAARALENDKIAGDIAGASDARDAAKRTAENRAAEAAALERNLNQNDVANREGRVRELEAEKTKVREQIAKDIFASNRGLPGTKDVDTIAREGRVRVSSIDQQIAQEKSAIAASKSPEAEAFRKEQIALLSTLKNAAKEADDAAKSAEEAWRGLARRMGDLAPVRREEDRARLNDQFREISGAIKDQEANGGPTVPADVRGRKFALEEMLNPSSEPRSLTTVSEPARMIVNGVDITERVNASLRKQEAMGEAATRFARAVEAAAASANGTVEKLDAATQILEQQLRANRR